MRVLVLGIGKMGYGLLKDLTAQSRIEEVVAADINITQAKHFAERVGNEKIEVRRCDVNDRQETVRLMGEGFDAIASALPRPFCDSAVAAAIEAGVGYADVAASFATIFDQNEAARKAGVTVVPHIGLDIGVDRVLCGVGARKLDEVDGFKVWCGGFPQKGNPGYLQPNKIQDLVVLAIRSAWQCGLFEGVEGGGDDRHPEAKRSRGDILP